MSVTPEALAKRFLRREWQHLSSEEKQVIDALLRRSTVGRDAAALADESRTLGERLADRIAAFGGSWTFITMFLGFLAAWAMLNSEVLGRAAFDPYPYIFLNLFLSMVAALQAPIIMMSQNRQVARDRIDARNDYRVNLKAEMQIHDVHDKLDELRTERWEELLRLQREQLRLLALVAGVRPDALGDGGNG